MYMYYIYIYIYVPLPLQPRAPPPDFADDPGPPGGGSGPRGPGAPRRPHPPAGPAEGLRLHGGGRCGSLEARAPLFSTDLSIVSLRLHMR